MVQPWKGCVGASPPGVRIPPLRHPFYLRLIGLLVVAAVDVDYHESIDHPLFPQW